MKQSIKSIIFLSLLILFIHEEDKLIALEDEKDITHILNKKQFEAVVQYVLENGEFWEFYSSLWGSTQYLDLIDFNITLEPDLGKVRFPNIRNRNEWYDVLNWNGISIRHFNGLATADLVLVENNVYVTRIINGSCEYNEDFNILINTCIPRLKLLIK